jgi:hypothetical protein
MNGFFFHVRERGRKKQPRGNPSIVRQSGAARRNRLPVATACNIVYKAGFSEYAFVSETTLRGEGTPEKSVAVMDSASGLLHPEKDV